MKKSCFLSFMLALMLALCACNSVDVDDALGLSGVSKDAIEGVSEYHQNAPETNPALLFENPAIGIGLIFPHEWEGKYTITTNFFNGGVNFSVFHTATLELFQERGYQEGGLLFWVDRQSTQNDLSIYNELGRLMLQTEDFAFFMRTPTDVQYDDSDPLPRQSIEYRELYDYENGLSLLWAIADSAFPVSLMEQPPAMPDTMTDEWLLDRVKSIQPTPGFTENAEEITFRIKGMASFSGEWWARVTAYIDAIDGYMPVTDYFVNADGIVYIGHINELNEAEFYE